MAASDVLRIVALVGKGDDGDGNVINFEQRRGAPKRRKSTREVDDELDAANAANGMFIDERDYSVIQAEVEKVKAESRIAVGKADLFDKAGELLETVNETTSWKKSSNN